MKKLLNFCLKQSRMITLLFIFIPLPAFSIHTSCFIETGNYFRIDPILLRSIAEVESNFNPIAINNNYDANGNIVSKDYGIMQINQSHVPDLIRNGIIKSERDLLSDPCLNIKIGAWILYKHFSRCGINWECLGSYNAGFSESSTQKRKQYALKVHKIYMKNSNKN